VGCLREDGAGVVLGVALGGWCLCRCRVLMCSYIGRAAVSVVETCVPLLSRPWLFTPSLVIAQQSPSSCMWVRP